MPRVRRRHQPGPWRVVCRQINHKGIGSRPQIVDAHGKPVRLSRVPNATLAAAGPELMQALDKLAYRAELLALMLQSEHPGAAKPAELTQAQRLLWRLRLELT